MIRRVRGEAFNIQELSATGAIRPSRSETSLIGEIGKENSKVQGPPESPTTSLTYLGESIYTHFFFRNVANTWMAKLILHFFPFQMIDLLSTDNHRTVSHVLEVLESSIKTTSRNSFMLLYLGTVPLQNCLHLAKGPPPYSGPMRARAPRV